ncbi:MULTISPECIES: OmpW family protein [unclassified Acinetobacter]|uniref:OmpW/AlkL family protein n=1 Tax=unclassified Acinetobacter TaxID=196816 RepID=UPI0015D33097|nr:MULTISPECIES: OmpW family outer membrane protein [unclassified Acinetobacter]UUS58710.1 outer membrane beta-barrel protein [Acinetobacter sp. YH16040_T]
MKKSVLCIAASMAALPMLSHADSPYFSLKDGDGFKRFSVSVGALHVMPQGKAQPFNVKTAAYEGIQSDVGQISTQAVIDNRVENSSGLANWLVNLINGLNPDSSLPSFMSGSAQIYGLESWDNPGTGLEADDVTTLGIMTNYFFTDNISFEMKAGVPPKVDLQGKGKIYAPFSAVAKPIVGTINLDNDIFITNLEAHGAAASARAWTPAFEFQYHFGKTGVNKFRPYVGLGLMYAYFNELEINPQTEKDLIAAGHMIYNILDNKAGAALDGSPNPNAKPKVELDATDAFAPVVTAGFTYDFNDKWFAVGSVSYAHLKNETTITVSDPTYGKLIESKADIEVNPILVYAGVGMRF